MSLAARLILAIVSAVFGVMMMCIAPPTDKAPFFYAFGAFCPAISVACVARGRVARFFGSCVSVAILGMAVWFVVSTATAGRLVSVQAGESSLVDALFFMMVFGLPAAGYVWMARFGFCTQANESANEPPGEVLSIEYDELEVRVRVLKDLEDTWNQTFQWDDIKRVCFKDQGLYASDMLIIELRSGQKPAIVLTEARGGSSFFGALTERGCFPEHLWRSALRETSGGLHCWPPKSDTA